MMSNLTILVLCADAEDSSEAVALRQACQDALQATPSPGNVCWLTRPPDKQTDIDLLISAQPAAWFARTLDGLCPRPALAVLVLPSSPPDGSPPLDPEALSAADELLFWPCPAGVLGARMGQWIRQARHRRHAETMDGRVGDLTRDNSTLRRQIFHHVKLMELREQHDGSLRQIVARIDGVTRLCQQINSLQLDQVVQLCIQRVPPLLGAKLASLYLLDEGKRLLRLQQHNHPYPINAVISLDERPNSPMALAVSRKQLLMVNEPGWAELVNQSVTRPYAHRYASGNCVIAPLCSGGRVVGVLNLADKHDNLPFDELTDLLPIRQLSELLGASIRNIELYQTVQQQAKTDGMTGLANHSTFMRELGREISRASRYGSALSLILADVDSLKRMNDQLGHVVGDRAIQMVARQIVNSIRESDLAARYGGDEFAVLLPSTLLKAARAVAERIVTGLGTAPNQWPVASGQWPEKTGTSTAEDSSLDTRPLALGTSSAPVTVSVGVGQYDGKSTAEQFIEQVDQAMYRAKREGKNRIAGNQGLGARG